MVGATLSTPAEFFMQDTFSAWDPATETFPTSFIGRMERIDRFKTIYNRPTRRETLTFKNGVTMPASGVIKRDSTGEIFLVSSTIQSEYWGGTENYENLATLHRVTPEAGGAAAYHAVTTAGSGADLGPVSLAAAVPCYVDLELRTMQRDREEVETVTAEMLAFFSKNVEPEAGDYFLFDGKYYRVSEYFIDSGMHSARFIKEDPAYTTLTFQQSTGTTSYNPTTGTVTSGTTSRQISAIISKQTTGRGRDLGQNSFNKMLDLYIYKRHVGFTPSIGEKFALDGTTYEVTLVEQAKDADQWHLEASV